MPECVAMTRSDLERLSKSHDEFLVGRGWSAAPGALLPSEFVASFLAGSGGREDWLGVWAVEERRVIGSGMFKSAPVDGRVEIGYGVAPEVEGRGVAMAICAALWGLASGRATEVVAHTLPDGVASAQVLAKNGFVRVGEVTDPEDGPVIRYEKRI